MKTRVNIDLAWQVITNKKVKILASAKATYTQAQRVLSVVDDGVVDRMAFSEILHYDKDLIVFEKGYTIEKDEITASYMIGDWLFICKSSWTMVFKVY